jgi:hypothetical protein
LAKESAELNGEEFGQFAKRGKMDFWDGRGIPFFLAINFEAAKIIQPNSLALFIKYNGKVFQKAKSSKKAV